MRPSSITLVFAVEHERSYPIVLASTVLEDEARTAVCVVSVIAIFFFLHAPFNDERSWQLALQGKTVFLAHGECFLIQLYHRICVTVFVDANGSCDLFAFVARDVQDDVVLLDVKSRRDSPIAINHLVSTLDRAVVRPSEIARWASRVLLSYICHCELAPVVHASGVRCFAIRYKPAYIVS